MEIIDWILILSLWILIIQGIYLAKTMRAIYSLVEGLVVALGQKEVLKKWRG